MERERASQMEQEKEEQETENQQETEKEQETDTENKTKKETEEGKGLGKVKGKEKAKGGRGAAETKRSHCFLRPLVSLGEPFRWPASLLCCNFSAGVSEFKKTFLTAPAASLGAPWSPSVVAVGSHGAAAAEGPNCFLRPRGFPWRTMPLARVSTLL